MTRRTAILDAIVDIVGTGGYRSASAAAIAHRAGISQHEFQREFPRRADWVEAAYERLYERRLEQFRKAVATVPAGNTDPSITLTAVMSTFLDGEQADPLYAASYDLFFFSRDDPRLLARLHKIGAHWTAKIDEVVPGFFPRATSSVNRDLFMTHAAYVGTVPLSNGFKAYDVRPEDYPVMLSLISAG